jgi:carbonic anhydrase
MHRFPAYLLDGYRRFMQGRFAREQERYQHLAEAGQRPRTMIIACCDSRAAPETVFDCGPGELFVLRNVANLVPRFEPDGGQHGTSAAIEFAVNNLQVENVVVMGHGRCGGIQAALSESRQKAAGDFIGKWMSLLDPVIARSGIPLADDETQRLALERESVRNSLRNLRSFPYVAARESEKTLSLHGAWFDISKGELWLLVPDSGEFVRAGE